MAAIRRPRPDLRRLEMCAAVLHIDAIAWDGTPLALPAAVGPARVAEVEETLTGSAVPAQSGRTGTGPETKTPCNWTGLQGAQMVTRTGLEPMFSA